MASTPEGLDELHRVHQQLDEQQNGRKASGGSESARLKAKLTGALKALPDHVRSAYDRVVESKGLDAISLVEGQACSSCFQMLTLNMYSNLKLGKVVICGSCGRLLYLDADADA